MQTAASKLAASASGLAGPQSARGGASLPRPGSTHRDASPPDVGGGVPNVHVLLLQCSLVLAFEHKFAHDTSLAPAPERGAPPRKTGRQFENVADGVAELYSSECTSWRILMSPATPTSCFLAMTWRRRVPTGRFLHTRRRAGVDRRAWAGFS